MVHRYLGTRVHVCVQVHVYHGTSTYIVVYRFVANFAIFHTYLLDLAYVGICVVAPVFLH